MSLAAFAGRRLAGAAVLFVLLSAVIFAATAVLPGDAVSAVAGVDASEAQRAEVRAELGLDRPAAARYADWVAGAARGDLGRGFVGDRPVTEVLAARLPNSLLLAGLTLAVTAPLATLLGLWTGLRGGGAGDRIVSTAAQTLAAVPEFVVAALLVAVLAVWLEILPRVSVVPLGGTPLDVPHALILPVLTLSAVGLAVATRLLRASVADAAATPYCEAARLNGVRGVRLAVRHILPNAAAPAVQALTLTTGALVGSAVVVENVFDYPGIGRELQLAVAARDIPMVQGIATALAGVMLLVLLTGDICARLLGAREGQRR
ncbi:ABC transporter permease [Streptomyces sp. NPDC096191]|uniref:ABC transporter permease n=1 Tax=Streptomyces sp. NPDC096191 TaxID=3155426 RepID=UPI00332E05A5